MYLSWIQTARVSMLKETVQSIVEHADVCCLDLIFIYYYNYNIGITIYYKCHYTFIDVKLNILIHYRYVQTTQINLTIKTIFMFQVPYLHIEFHKGQICRWLLLSYLWKGIILSLQWYVIHAQKDIKKGIAKHQIHIQT